MQVARFQLLIELTKINEASTKEQLELERKRVEGGGGIQVDELQAKTRLQIVRERSVFYNQGLRDALATYEQVFGKAPNLSAFQMIDIANSALPANVQQAISEGERNSPDIKSAGLEIEKQEQRFNQTKSLKLPKLDLVAMKSEDVNKNALSGRNDEFIGFEMTWNFSFGGEFDAREASAKNRLAATEQRAQNVSNRNKEQVIIAYNQVVNGSERLELLESAADISKSVMMDRKRLRDAGKETALSALDAEVEYYGVLANKINAQIDTKIGGYRLLAAMGKLSSDDLSVFGRFKVPAKPLRVAIDEL
jgi:adhesin transport system outer membrane protein